jgi:hypothetical protein
LVIPLAAGLLVEVVVVRIDLPSNLVALGLEFPHRK